MGTITGFGEISVFPAIMILGAWKEKGAMVVDWAILNSSSSVSKADSNMKIGSWNCANKIVTPKGHVSRDSLTSPVGSVNTDWGDILKWIIKFHISNSNFKLSINYNYLVESSWMAWHFVKAGWLLQLIGYWSWFVFLSWFVFWSWFIFWLLTVFNFSILLFQLWKNDEFWLEIDRFYVAPKSRAAHSSAKERYESSFRLYLILDAWTPIICVLIRN